MPGIAETDAFARLRWDWGSAYDFARDDNPVNPQPYTAVRKDGKGTLTAADPDTLRDAVLGDYLARSVPREAAS
ncbi:hypothetical protein [Trebonia sp.]|uniref:hypothetical protein n=1 Tax=Trebonia sp. TaxID=2767075 RepID=UPI00262CA286|nr:hypothetical protein [Trebonia sp.]